MDEIRIVATVISKETETHAVKKATQLLAKKSRQERGCILYELHEVKENPSTFIFYEIWKNQKSVDEHNQATHFVEFIQQIENKVESVDIKVVSKIA